MTRLLQTVAVLALACAGWLCCEAAWTAHQVRPKLLVAIQNFDGTVLLAQGVLGDAQKASQAALAAEQQQIVMLDKTSIEIYKTTAAARLVLVRLDRTLNDDLGPKLAANLEESQKAISVTAQSLENASKGLQPSLVAFAGATARLSEILASDTIPDSLANVDASSKNLADGTRSLAGVAADAKNLADYELQQLERPEKVWLAVLKFVLSEGSAARILFKGSQ